MKRRGLQIEYDAKRKLYQPKLSEEHVLREIVERLWLQAKIKVWRIRERIPGMSKKLSTPGIPDLIGHFRFTNWNGAEPWSATIPLYIEVKRPAGARRVAQIRFIAEAKSDGCIAFFAESWDDVVKELREYGVRLVP